MVDTHTLTFSDWYCSTVQGLLDLFEVDLGFTELSFIQITGSSGRYTHTYKSRHIHSDREKAETVTCNWSKRINSDQRERERER